MTDFEMGDRKLQIECEALAKEIFGNMLRYNLQDDETPEDHADTMSDHVHEAVDSHGWIIYYYKAHQICMYCDTDQGEQFLEDVGPPETPTYDSLAVTIAFGEMHARISTSLQELVNNWEPADEVAA